MVSYKEKLIAERQWMFRRKIMERLEENNVNPASLDVDQMEKLINEIDFQRDDWATITDVSVTTSQYCFSLFLEIRDSRGEIYIDNKKFYAYDTIKKFDDTITTVPSFYDDNRFSVKTMPDFDVSKNNYVLSNRFYSEKNLLSNKEYKEEETYLVIYLANY